MLIRLLIGLRGLFRRSQVEQELDTELRCHIELETEENIRRGMNPEDARLAAVRSFGRVEKIKDDCRDVRPWRHAENLRRDLRHGARVLLKNPGYTLTAAMTLALGIGANTAVFSVVHGVLLRPLPYGNGDSLVLIQQRAPLAQNNDLRFSVSELEDYRAQCHTLETVVEHHSMNFILYGRPEPERVQTGVVSFNFFEVMGVRALFGRTFSESDEAPGAEAVLILSHDYWRRSHGSDIGIVGRVFEMNNRPHTVIGVLPPLPGYPTEDDVFMPTSACPTRSSDGFIANRNARMMRAFGLIKPGVAHEQVEANVATVASRLMSEHPDSYPEQRGYQAAALPLQDELSRDARPTFLVLLGAAMLVLLIACANVANLTLARLMRREREMALRAALGASRSRLLCQLAAESSLLSVAGGALGVLLAWSALDLLVRFAREFSPRANEIELDASVLIFTLVVSIGAGLVFGLLPAFSVGKGISTVISEGGGSQVSVSRARKRLRSALVVSQVAVSFTLLVGAGLMLRSLYNLQRVEPGFNPERVLAMRISPNWSRYTQAVQYRDFALRLVEKARTLPGVASAAIATNYPLNQLAVESGPLNQDFLVEGRDAAEGELSPRAEVRVVSQGYFETLGLPLVRGRLFADSDDSNGEPVALLSQSLALRRWGDEDPIGRRISHNSGQTWVRVVGIVGDVRQHGLDRDAADAIYRPIAQSGGGGQLLLRATADPVSLVRQAREAVYAIDPETAIDRVQTLQQAVSDATASPRLTAILLGLFALLALVITATGIAGVMALSVSQRRHEIGIRMAIGASQSSVRRMIVRQGMTLVVGGLMLGLLSALALSRVMSSLLFGVEPTDPLTFLSVALVIPAVAAVSCLIPARRVTGIDPILALRSE